jgi:hypothetical protein
LSDQAKEKLCLGVLQGLRATKNYAITNGHKNGMTVSIKPILRSWE